MHFTCLGEAMGEKKTNLNLSCYSLFFGLAAKTFVEFEPRKFQHDPQFSTYCVKVLGRFVKLAFYSSNWKIFIEKIAKKFFSGFFENFHQCNQNCIGFVRRKKMAEQNWTRFSVSKNFKVWTESLRVLSWQFLAVFSILCLACPGGRFRPKRK